MVFSLYTVIWFFFSFTLCGGITAQSLHPKILRKYYTFREIENNNLKIESTRNQIIISNGDILPQHEYKNFLIDLYTKLIPFFSIWVIIFLIYFSLYKGKPKLSEHEVFKMQEKKRKSDKKKRKQIRLEQERQTADRESNKTEQS